MQSLIELCKLAVLIEQQGLEMAPVLAPLGSTMLILQPHPKIYAFYDGRVENTRTWSLEPNWLDDSAYTLGCCSYAVVDRAEALVFDTGLSIPHARLIRDALEAAGYRSIRVALSHWHDDHIAGNAVFQDCDIIANHLTAETLAIHAARLEAGNPPIRPLIQPNRVYEQHLHLRVGDIAVELRQADVHSHDGSVLYLPAQRLLLAGDTVEDPVTFVSEPERLAIHLGALIDMSGWEIERILPCHGDPEVIAAGGYGKALITATIEYVSKLLRARAEPALARQSLGTFLQDYFLDGTIIHYAAYDEVHRNNIRLVLGD